MGCLSLQAKLQQGSFTLIHVYRIMGCLSGKFVGLSAQCQFHMLANGAS